MRLDPELVTAPAELAVTLDAAKAHLRVDDTDQDDEITAALEAAIGHFDGHAGVLNRCLVTQAWREQSSKFDGPRIALRLAPILTLPAIAYIDAAGAEQTVATDDYRLTRVGGVQFLELASGASWPAVGIRSDAVTISYSAGYGAAAAVPQALKTAIKFKTELLVDRPQDPAPLEAAIARLIRPYRRALVCV